MMNIKYRRFYNKIKQKKIKLREREFPCNFDDEMQTDSTLKLKLICTKKKIPFTANLIQFRKKIQNFNLLSFNCNLVSKVLYGKYLLVDAL